MTTALYRRYRPETFEEVIGQEHVTGPLMQALRSDRVNHAYLFSGPRGCGKTTSARILARILNCARNTAESPRATPCGECESCVELGRGGSGSLDVVEIDAASHGGVDDARDLRERATFSPSRDRYKIFILDEAHMVTSAGFNALLKIVEEPPPYLKFVFATTEPEKVIGTIRSRTHHYPFRLVAPEVLQPYLEQVCASEKVDVGSGVLPLVVRAGGGSVRDSLSILDQLMAGSQGSSIDYEMAAGLLGFTPVTLLDDVVEALAASDGASLFGVVDRIVATGHEPRRFVEDLLERLRDLVVMAVSGEQADAVFGTLPEDQRARMRTQAGNLGFAELSRAADVVNTALSEMTGATSPRLHLELLCARLLLPTADDGARGIAARVDRLERAEGLRPGAGTPSTATGASAARPAPPVAARPRTARPEPVGEPPATSTPPEAASEPEPRASREPVPAAAPERPEAAEPSAAREPSGVSAPSAAASGAPAASGAEAPAATPAASSTGPDPAPATGGQGVTTAELRRRWPEVLDTLTNLRKATWALVSQNAQVHSLSDTLLELVFPSGGLATAFRNGPHGDLVRQAVRETLGVDVRVDGIVLDGGTGGPAASSGPDGPEPPDEDDPRRGAAGAGPGTTGAAGGPRPGTGSTPIVAGPVTGTVPAVDTAAAAASWDLPPRSSSGGTGRGGSGAAPRPDDDAEDDLDGPLPSDQDEAEDPGSPEPSSAPQGAQHDVPRDRETASPARQAPQALPPALHGQGQVDPARSATSARAAAVAAVSRSRAGEPHGDVPAAPEELSEEEAWDSVDVTDGNALVGAPLVAQMLGGTVIDEIVEPEEQ